jgi:metal-responsive CopG/Arc/MetJ family transcriptional regulator
MAKKAQSKKTHGILVTVDQDEYEALNMIKKRDKRSKSEIIKFLIDEYLESDRDAVKLMELQDEERHLNIMLKRIEKERKSLDESAEDYKMQRKSLLMDEMAARDRIFQIRGEKSEFQEKVIKR